MSFSHGAKSELCRIPVSSEPLCGAELYGALLFSHTFNGALVRIISKNADFLARLDMLLERCLGLCFCEVKAGSRLITDEKKLKALFSFFDLEHRPGQTLHLNHANLQETGVRSAFCRGVFLAGGSITDPEKKYHLELLTPHRYLARELIPLLREDGFEPKLTLRSGVHVLVFQSSESIEDFMTFIGAPVSALALMETKAMKEFRNGINRRVNCESGNISRTVGAVSRQMPALERLLAGDRLPPVLYETAKARVEYPEDSLSELAERLGIGKSALNHRLRKLEALAEDEKIDASSQGG